MTKLGFHLIDKPNEDFESCSECVHANDSEEICTMRKCVHAIKYLYDCYEKAERKDVPDTNVGKWIPVSERLPGKDGKYLITELDGYVTCDYFRLDNGDWKTTFPIAWMPLPEAFEPQEREVEWKSNSIADTKE